MAIKRKDFQKVSSTVQEFLLKLPDEEASARLRDNLLQALHLLQLYYRDLQKRDKESDPLQWTIDHSLSPLTPFKDAPDKFDWQWVNIDSTKARQSLTRTTKLDSFTSLPSIIVAIREGDIGLVKQLVKEDLSYLNQCDSFNRDCLTYSVEFEEFEIFKYMLKHGANVNCVATDGSTCLHRAVYKDNNRMVKLLLEYGAHVDAQDSYSRSPIHWSVLNKKTDCLKTLIEYAANIHARDRDGMSAAMWACHLDHLEHFKLIVQIDDKENDEMEFDNDGRSWIHWCVRKNEKLECLNTLLSPDTALIKDKDGKTCLHIAAEQGAIDACKLIVSIVGKQTVHQIDNKKQTPLHLAALNGHARVIKFLFEYGAEPYQRDIEGASVVDYVSKRKLYFCQSIIEMCLKQSEKKTREDSETSMSVSNFDSTQITPAPPTTPKSIQRKSFAPSSPNVPSSPIGNPPVTPTNPAPLPSPKEPNKSRPPKPGFRYMKRSKRIALSEQNSLSMESFELETPVQDKVTTSVQSNPAASFPMPSRPPISTTKSTPPIPSPAVDFNLKGNTHEPASTERMQSASARPSRVSSRSSFVSEDLDKYMSNVKPVQPPPTVPPRTTPTRQIIIRAFSGKSLDTSLQQDQYETQPPPVVKPRKTSSRGNSFTYGQELESDDLYFQKQNENKDEDKNNYLDVEDISGDEEKSVTSTRGEGYGSDFSDSEVRNISGSRKSNTSKKSRAKRPTTPMEIRLDNPTNNHSNQRGSDKSKAIYQPDFSSTHPQNSNKTIKYQQIGEQQISYHRFNEWDPFNKTNESKQQFNERQKSSQQKPGKLSSSVDHNRQTSGRGFLQSATNSQMHASDRQQAVDSTFSGSLDLVISGQKLGIKDNNSPTNTPRENNPAIRPLTRRLHPIDRNIDLATLSSNENEQIVKQVKHSEMHKLKQKKTSALDRKKLEPIKHNIMHNQGSLYNNNEIETEVQLQPNQSVDEDLSISENTVSSEKQIQSQFVNSIKMSRAKASAAQHRHTYTAKKTRLIEQLFNNDSESLKS